MATNETTSEPSTELRRLPVATVSVGAYAFREEDGIRITRAGTKRFQALAERNAERDDIPRYLGTHIASVNVVHEEHMDLVQAAYEAGDQKALDALTLKTRAHLNEGERRETYAQGQTVLGFVVAPVLNKKTGEHIRGRRDASPLKGRRLYQLVSVEAKKSRASFAMPWAEPEVPEGPETKGEGNGQSAAENVQSGAPAGFPAPATNGAA